jgi:hemerythrin-like domain-containing protein
MSVKGNPYAETRDMYTVHTMFRREYALLPGLVRAVAAKDEERAKVVADHVRLVNLILHHHHSAEDATLWPALLHRAPREIDPVIRLLEGQHDGLDVLLDEVSKGLDGWTDGADCADGETLAAVLQRLAAALYEHMGLEEKLALPLVERHIFAAEWEEMVAAGAADVPSEIGPLLVIVPPELRDVLGEMAPTAYAGYCEGVHGTPAPPRSSEVGLGTPYVGIIGHAGRA